MINEKNKDVVVDCKQAAMSRDIKNNYIVEVAEEFFGCNYFQSHDRWDHRRHYYLFTPSGGRPQVVGSLTETPRGKDYVERVIDFDQMLLETYSPLILAEKSQVEFNEELL